MKHCLGDDIRSEAERQGKLMPFALLAGQVVDDVITASIREYLQDRHWLENLPQLARSIAKEYRDKSLSLRAQHEDGRNPRQPIAETYFGDYPTKEEWGACFENIERNLTTFTNSEIRSYLTSFPIESWRVQDKGAFSPWFRFEEIPIYAKYDFIITAPGKTIIFDWKTGQPFNGGEEKALEQLHGYALFAHTEWGIPLEEIALAPVWLSQSMAQPWSESPVDNAKIESLKSTWRSTYDDIKWRAEGFESSEMTIDEAFPLSESKNECSRCTFRVCPSYVQADPDIS